MKSSLDNYVEEQESKTFYLGDGVSIDPTDIIVPSDGCAQFKFQKLEFKPGDDGGTFYFSDKKTLASGTFSVKVFGSTEYIGITISGGKISPHIVRPFSLEEIMNRRSPERDID